MVGKSKDFALRCIRLYQLLVKDRSEFVLSKQLLRSGTSIGANVKEALRGQSKADFAMKLNIDKVILNPEIATYNNYKWIVTLYKNKNTKR